MLLVKLQNSYPTVSENDRESLRLWANNSFLENWMNDPVAKSKVLD